MNPKQLEKEIEELKKWKAEKMKKEKDIVDILKEAGFGVVEGKEAVLDKINELAEKKPTTDSRMPLGFN